MMKLSMSMTKCLSAAIFIIPLAKPLQAQRFPEEGVAKVIAVNVASGALVGGVGAMINKRPDQEYWQAFLHGSKYGALGGTLNYTSKHIARQIYVQENYIYGWPARIVQSAGTSIIENAAANRAPLERYHFCYGPVRLEVNAKRHYMPSLKIQPIALGTMLYMGSRGEFNRKVSLRSGTPVFVYEDQIRMFGGSYDGYVFGTALSITGWSLEDYDLFTHEFIHVHQYEDFIGLNSFLDQPAKKWREKSPLFRNLSKVIYWDYHAPVMYGSYQLLHVIHDDYYANWFEYEAEHFN